MDITIQNPQEFSRFLESGRFQRQHMSSLLSQVFDPAFIFNAIYHNVAKLINRRILTSNPKPLTMTQRVPRCHFPILEKLSQLFFKTKKTQYKQIYPPTKDAYSKHKKLHHRVCGWFTKFLHIIYLSSVM